MKDEWIKVNIDSLVNELMTVNGESLKELRERKKEAIMKISDQIMTDYIGFEFDAGIVHNDKLLNLLWEVIPPIDEFEAHEGGIRIELKNGEVKEFSGETSSEIVKWLVDKKIELDKKAK